MKKIAAIICTVWHVCAAHSVTLSDVYNTSLDKIFTNLNHPEVSIGAIIASPSKWAPDYFSHWTRDAALTENALYQAYQVANPTLKAKLLEQAKNWILFEMKAQKNSLTAVAGLGEPRYTVDGMPVTFPWARPQDDGPAARALMAMRWARILKENGHAEFAKSLYTAELPATSFIKRDLEYISHRWHQHSHDLWEEINGTHFFTRVIQLEALKEASLFAAEWNDPEASNWYALQAELLRKEFPRFLTHNRNYISASIETQWTHKKTELDSAVLIAANLGFMNEDFFVNHKEFFLNTAQALEDFFKDEYAINRDYPERATAIGRYPEDVYTGVDSLGPAHAWFITTHAMAEFYCKFASLERDARKAAELKEKGQRFFERTLLHRNQDTFEMSEQYSRNDGTMQGATSLTWSYSSFLTAHLACL